NFYSFFFSSRRRHTRWPRDWSSDVCSSDLVWVGFEAGRLFHWSAMDSIFLGAMLSVSSTTIIVKALAELGKSKERFAELIFGIQIGRASCRERLCMSVVEVAVEKIDC